MGTRKGMDLLCKKLEQLPPDPTFPFYVMYTPDRANGDELAQHVERLGISPTGIIPVGAAIGSHIGPDACGLVYVGL